LTNPEIRLRLCDTHCHLEKKDFSKDDVDERPEIVARARAAGVEQLVCIGSGSTIEQMDNAVAYADSDPNIWAAVGIHPHDVTRMPATAPAHIEELARTHPRVVAVGEIGLDFYYDHSPRAEQVEWFGTFLQIAQRVQKPVVLHIRDAHDESRAALTANPPPGGVVHCFTGNLRDAEQYVAMGLYISFSGIVTFKSARDIQEAAKWVPEDRILIETDCPYLAPVPMRGRRNEPSYLPHTAAFLAQLRGTTVDAIAESTTANAHRLFRLS
jgi:TatD DNase family protein